MKKPELWLGFEILTTDGQVLQPHRLQFWDEKKFKSTKPESPFYYKADALTGLSLIQLNRHLQNPFTSPKMNFAFATEAWLAFEPHHEMHARSQPRVAALRKYLKPTTDTKLVQGFEAKVTEVLDLCLQPWGFDLDVVTDVLKHIDWFEAKMGSPLLYNFTTQFSKDFSKTLQHLHSLLFNLRALMAVDHNAYVQDSTYECVRVDSISDYLPKAEYVANDAVLFWHFCKLKDNMPANVASELGRAFAHFSHNATCLVENLPGSFLKSLPGENFEDALYLAQMDWLLGTDAGLLFRIREELYGLAEGYEKIFWPELEGKPQQASHRLTVNCQIGEFDLYPSKAAS